MPAVQNDIRIRKHKKQNKHLPGRIILFFSIVAFICLLLLLSNEFGGLRRIIYMIGSGVSGGTTEQSSITFDGNDLNKFHVFRGGLAVVSPDTFTVYKISGKKSFSEPVLLHTPAVSGCRDFLAAYDRNGLNFLVANRSKILLKSKAPAPIIRISMNKNGAFALITDGPDCKSLVTVYNSSMNEIYKLHSTEQYIFDTVVSNDSKKMAVLGFSAKGGHFEGSVTLYKLDDEKPINTVSLQDSMPLSAVFTSSNEVLVICEDRQFLLNKDGKQKAVLNFDGFSLSGYSLNSNKFDVLLLDKYKVGGNSQLIVSKRNESEPVRINYSEEVFGVSSAGTYVAVQFLDRVTVYNSDLTENHTYPISTDVRSCIMREDGTVLAIGDNFAKLLIP